MICSAYLGSTYCEYSSVISSTGVLHRRVTSLSRGEIVLGREGAAFDHGVGDLAGEEADGAQRVVVAGDHPVDFIGIAVGIDDRHHRDTETAGFLHRNRFLVRIDHEDHVRQARACL